MTATAADPDARTPEARTPVVTPPAVRARVHTAPAPPPAERLRPPSEPPPSTSAPFAILDALTVLALVCAWAALQALFFSGLSQVRAQDVMYSELRTQLASATAPVGGAIPPGGPVALLQAPSIGLQQVVVEGTTGRDLLSGPGHRRDTALPGQEGTSLVYGRARTYGGPFADIASLRPGDTLSAITGQGVATYVVEGVRRAGDPLPQPVADGQGRLTLASAEGSGRLAGLRPRSVVYVDARLTSEPFPTPAGRPAYVGDAERAMGQHTADLPMLAFALQGVLAVAVGVVLLRRRFSGVVVWVLAVPVVVALAWWCTDLAVPLLPNLM